MAGGGREAGGRANKETSAGLCRRGGVDGENRQSGACGKFSI